MNILVSVLGSAHWDMIDSKGEFSNFIAKGTLILGQFLFRKWQSFLDGGSIIVAYQNILVPKLVVS